MRTICLIFIFFTVSSLTLRCARAWDPAPSPLHQLVEEADMIGVIEIVGVDRERPLHWRARFQKTYKGYYKKDGRLANQYISLNLTEKIHPRFSILDPLGESLVEKEFGALYFAYLKRVSDETETSTDVMSLVTWRFQSLQLIENNLISGILGRPDFYSTHDYISAIERLIEVDSIEDRKEKVSALQQLQKSKTTVGNGQLFAAVRNWLRFFDLEIEQQEVEK